MNMKTKAGEEPAVALAASISRSGMTMARPKLSMSRRQRASSASVAPGPGTTAVHPAFTRAGVFGMQRMSRMAVTSRSKRPAMRSSVRPAAMEITRVFSLTASRISAITSGKNWGFTASTSTSAASATSRLLAVTAMPNCSARFCRVASVLAEPDDVGGGDHSHVAVFAAERCVLAQQASDNGCGHVS